MITIKDPVLGKYWLKETFQGVEVYCGDKNMSKQQNLDGALRWVAERLLLDEELELTLCEYTNRRKQIYESLRAAQEPKQPEVVQPTPMQPVMETAHSGGFQGGK